MVRAGLLSFLLELFAYATVDAVQLGAPRKWHEHWFVRLLMLIAILMAFHAALRLAVDLSSTSHALSLTIWALAGGLVLAGLAWYRDAWRLGFIVVIAGVVFTGLTEWLGPPSFSSTRQRSMAVLALVGYTAVYGLRYLVNTEMTAAAKDGG